MEIISLEIKLIRIPGFSFVKNISPVYTCNSHTHSDLLAVSATGIPERLQYWNNYLVQTRTVVAEA